MAHRIVLAAASPYFAELFSSDVSRKEVEGIFYYINPISTFYLVLYYINFALIFHEGGGILYELEGGFSKEALDTLIDYAYTST